ncbi:MAG TPA: hypothetical protein DCM08_00820 [Microscillaceae bacterium]|jgi:hypothetical protein|nr:hypothetical protein [Microscillaceae bacterium]
MEHSAYSQKDLKPTSIFRQLLGGKYKPNAIIEINNLLAEKDLLSITIDDIQHIAEKYSASLHQEFAKELLKLYKDYLQICLEDKYISEAELNDLRHLKYILSLTDMDVEQAHQELAGKIYQTELERALADKNLDEQEKLFIEKLQNDLRLPRAVADKIFEHSSSELMNTVIQQATEDILLNPTEETELMALANNLNLDKNLLNKTKANFEKYKLFWQIENDQLPALETEIYLPKSEQVVFMTKAQWYEMVNERPQRIYSRSTLNIKIKKGEYWRKPTQEKHPADTKTWTLVGEGTLYLTNKRVLFKFQQQGVGDRVLLLNRVMDFKVFANGLEVDKEENRKDIFFLVEQNADVFAMVFGKSLLNHQ